MKKNLFDSYKSKIKIFCYIFLSNISNILIYLGFIIKTIKWLFYLIHVNQTLRNVWEGACLKKYKTKKSMLEIYSDAEKREQILMKFILKRE